MTGKGTGLALPSQANVGSCRPIFSVGPVHAASDLHIVTSLRAEINTNYILVCALSVRRSVGLASLSQADVGSCRPIFSVGPVQAASDFLDTW